MSFLRRHRIDEVVVLGGSGAVSDATFAALPPPQRRRVAGPERTSTAVAVATELWARRNLGAGGTVVINVRHDRGWQAALAAAVASALFDAPQLGVENPPAPLSDAQRRWLGSRSGPGRPSGTQR